MQNINIGKSGIQVPFLGMGTWAIGGGAWWGDNDDSLSVKAIQTAVEQGIQWIDTAPIYGLYHSETVVGEAMKHIDRDKVVLSTKCGLEWRHETPVLHKVVDGTTVYRDLSAKSIIEDVEDSLRRLHTDHLDVLYTHWQTPDFGIYPLEETVEAMMKLKEQGKIRAIGASNVTADIIRGYCKYGQLDVIQEKYSLLTRRVEKQLLPTCKELGVSVQAYSPLEQGLLTGKVTMETTYPEGSTRNSNPSFQPERRSQALDMLAKWGDLTEKYDCSLAQLVIALTARSDMDENYFCSHGFAGCLHKPFTINELFTAIFQATGKDVSAAGNPAPHTAPAKENHPQQETLDFSALTAFSEDDPEAAAEILRTFISETKKNREYMEEALAKRNMEGITAIAHKLLPLFTMLGATRCIPALTWMEQRRGTTEIGEEAIEKTNFIIEEIEKVIDEAKKQIEIPNEA